MWYKYKLWACRPTRPQSYHPVHSLWMCKPQSIQAGDNWIVPKSWLTHGLSLTTGSLIWFPVLTVSSNFSKQGWVCVYLYHQIKWRNGKIWSMFEYHVFGCCYWNKWKIKLKYRIKKIWIWNLHVVRLTSVKSLLRRVSELLIPAHYSAAGLNVHSAFTYVKSA